MLQETDDVEKKKMNIHEIISFILQVQDVFLEQFKLKSHFRSLNESVIVHNLY